MTIQEFDDLKIGDTCLVTRGKDKGKRCIREVINTCGNENC